LHLYLDIAGLAPLAKWLAEVEGSSKSKTKTAVKITLAES